jgi:hypothetical protein
MHGSIHIKIEYPEAVESKKNMLILEKSMLEIVNHVRAYDNLRKKEFAVKTQIKKSFTELAGAIAAIESHMPREESEFTQEGYKKERKIIEITKHAKKKEVEHKKSEIERQIEDIRSELARLG